MYSVFWDVLPCNPVKQLVLIGLHGVTNLKMELFLVIAVRYLYAEVDSEGFSRRCVKLGIIRFVDFVHRREF
jgi:hypothetical protein